MNIAGVTQSAPGYGSVTSPVVFVGQSLCGPCMASQVPFTGGSGRLLDRSLELAGLAKSDIFVTNVVHCHPPANRPSYEHEISNCRSHLRAELDIVKPRLLIGLGKDARAALEVDFLPSRVLPWPFIRPANKPTVRHPDLLFVPHPSWVSRQASDTRQRYVTSLAEAVTWIFDA
ncbi:uracil-DNA glycosylase [Mycolicibacterium sp. CBM1]